MREAGRAGGKDSGQTEKGGKRGKDSGGSIHPPPTAPSLHIPRRVRPRGTCTVLQCAVRLQGSQ